MSRELADPQGIIVGNPCKPRLTSMLFVSLFSPLLTCPTTTLLPSTPSDCFTPTGRKNKTPEAGLAVWNLWGNEFHVEN